MSPLLCAPLVGAPADAASLGNLANVAYQQAAYACAVALNEEALALRRVLGDTREIAGHLNNLAMVAYQRADYGRSAALCEEGLALQRTLGEKRDMANSLHLLAAAVLAQGNTWRAGVLFAEGLRLSQETGARDAQAEGLEGLAWLAAAGGQVQRAAWLGGPAEALRAALGVPLSPVQRAGHDLLGQVMRTRRGQRPHGRQDGRWHWTMP